MPTFAVIKNNFYMKIREFNLKNINIMEFSIKIHNIYVKVYLIDLASFIKKIPRANNFALGIFY